MLIFATNRLWSEKPFAPGYVFTKVLEFWNLLFPLKSQIVFHDSLWSIIVRFPCIPFGMYFEKCIHNNYDRLLAELNQPSSSLNPRAKANVPAYS